MLTAAGAGIGVVESQLALLAGGIRLDEARPTERPRRRRRHAAAATETGRKDGHFDALLSIAAVAAAAAGRTRHGDVAAFDLRRRDD